MLVDNLDMFLIQPKGSGKFEVPELQLTKSTKRGINLNIVLKRQTSQSNKCIAFFANSGSSPWQNKAKLNF